MNRDESAGPASNVPKWGYHVISALQLAGVALLVLGFSGWVLDDGGDVGLESPFTLAFGVGVGCALVSIYLGVFLANRE